jgi:hypothetical protein
MKVLIYGEITFLTHVSSMNSWHDLEIRLSAPAESPDEFFFCFRAESDVYVAMIGGTVITKMGPRYDVGSLISWDIHPVAHGNSYCVWEKSGRRHYYSLRNMYPGSSC